jgi:predicted enzyme related to lactoylglutathione lyase
MTILSRLPVSVVVPATDIERAKAFYRETLGLELQMDDDAGLMFSAGEGTGIFIYLRPGGRPAEHTVAGWRVPDIEAAVGELADRGIEFEQYDMPNIKTDERGIAVSDESKAAWFKDSEGNILSINEM